MKSDRYINLNDSWEFHKGDLGGIWEACRPVKKGDAEDSLRWENLSLPHCYNAYDSVDPDLPYYQGPAWYRRTIHPDNPFPGGRTLLHFEGSGQDTEVYFDGQKAGAHRGGYDEWIIEITELISSSAAESFLLTVRCDNSRDLQRIPSDLSDFTIYGGLYRSVGMIYEPPAFVRSMMITPKVGKDLNTADLLIDADLEGESRSVDLHLEVLDPEGSSLLSRNLAVEKGKARLEETVENPRLWSVDSPVLYQCTVTLKDRNGLWQKEYRELFGFRTFHFEKHGPFFLNGRRLLLKGTHRHEDHAGLGAAMTDELIEKEMEMIKAMGANFIRLGHYQQSSRVLDLCDSLGLLVWEEIPWCRGGLGNRDYRKLGKEMLENMIRQHYNPPSVFLWGLGNENDWPGDFPDFEEEPIRNYMSELHGISHELDRQRLTSIRRCGFCRNIPDVYSPSIWAGWYRGHYREYREATQHHIRETDRFLHAEWGAASHSGRFSEDPYEGLEHLKTGVGTDERGSDASLYGGISRVSKDGNWSENYACDLFDWTLKEQENMEELTGSAFWPFKDFATPLRPDNPLPYINQKGVVERDLTPKESFYVVQSFWSGTPMLRIFGHKWTERWGKQGESKEFRVYSNCSKVELFLDGKSLGIRTRDSQDYPAAGLRWTAALEWGNHEIRAIAPEESIEDSFSFQYSSNEWGAPASLELIESTIKGDETTVSLRIIDKQGRTCLDYGDYINYSIAGKGKLIDNKGTVRGARKVQMCNGKSEITISSGQGAAVLSACTENTTPLFVKL